MKDFLFKSIYVRIIFVFLMALVSQIIYDATLYLVFYYAFFVFLIGGFGLILYFTIRAFINQYNEYKNTKR
jgi:hypothetical protein